MINNNNSNKNQWKKSIFPMPDSEEERLFCRLISDKHAGKIKTNIEIRQHLINLKIKVPGQTCLNKIIKSYETRNPNDIRDSVGVSKMKVANGTCSTQSSASSIDKNEKEYRIENFNNFKILGLIDEGSYIKNFITQRANDAAIFVKESGYNVSNIVGHIYILKHKYMSADTSTLYYRCQNCLSLENKDRSDENCNLKTGATAQIKISSFIKNKDHIDKCKSIPLIDAIVKHAYQYFLKESESFVGVPIDEYDRFIYKIIAICRKLEIPAIEFFKNRNWATTSQCLKAFRQHKYNYIDKLVVSNSDSNDVFDLEDKSFILFEDENKEYVVFGSEENLRRLSSSKLWISDGTFRAAPKGWHQLFEIGGQFEEYGFRHNDVDNLNEERRKKFFFFIFCLTKNRKKSTYLRFFSQLKTYFIANKIWIQCERILMDRETAAMSAFSQIFPEIDIKLCMFHYSQNLLRALQHEGLSSLYKNSKDNYRRETAEDCFNYYILQLFSIPLLPTDKIESTALHILGVIDNFGSHENKLNHEKIKSFICYYKNNWIKESSSYKLKMLSHYHCEDRTSNGLESFHRKLNSRSVVGKHRKYEFFVEALKLLHFEEVIDFERHYSRELNEFTFLPTRRRYLERNRKIKALTNSFDVDGDNLLMVQKCAKLLAPRNVQQIFKSSGKIYTVEFDDSSDDSSDDLSNSDNFFDDTIIDVDLNAAFYTKEEVPKTRKRSCSSSSEKIVIKKRIDRNICNNVDKTVYPHDFLTSTKYYLDDQQVENGICLICGLKNISNFSIPLAAVSLEILKENPSISDSLVRGMFNPGVNNLFIMPLVYNNHWILFIVDTKKHEIYFYDSFDLYCNLISIFQKNFSNVIGIDINNYMITMIQGLKQDKNDFTNCGCYVVIEFYKFILHKETPKQLTPTQLWNLRVSWNDLLTELEKLS